MKLSQRPARTLAAMGLAIATIAFLGGCNGVPGDGAGMATPDQPALTAAKVGNRRASSSDPGSPSYLIGPMDVLQITVFKAPDLSKDIPVAEDGSINLPLIGPTRAAGRSTADLEQEIQKRLDAGYMRSPQVNVMVKEYNSSRITVEGAVKKPGVFPLQGRSTLDQAIAKAGGVDRETASDSVSVFRNVDGVRTMIQYDLGAIHSGQAEDPEVAAGDLVVVGDSTAKVGLNYILQVSPVGRLGVTGAQMAR